jgi:hypothetical protein
MRCLVNRYQCAGVHARVQKRGIAGIRQHWWNEWEINAATIARESRLPQITLL